MHGMNSRHVNISGIEEDRARKGDRFRIGPCERISPNPLRSRDTSLENACSAMIIIVGKESRFRIKHQRGSGQIDISDIGA